MELARNDRIWFDPISHSYLLDGEKILTGVTSLMKKHGLSADYSGIPEKVLNKAAEEGTAIHHLIEDYEAGKPVVREKLLDEYAALPLGKLIENEYIVSDNELAASAIDGVYQGNDLFKVVLVDYKTTQKYHKRPLEWQLGIYKVFFEMQNPGIEVEACYCLHIDRKKRKINGLIPVEPVSAEEVDDLLTCEAQGLIYVDPEEEHDITEVLPAEVAEDLAIGLQKIVELKAALQAAEQVVKDYGDKILLYMQEHNIATLETSVGKLSYVKGYTRQSVDSTKLKTEHPEIFAEYAKITQVKPSLKFNPKES